MELTEQEAHCVARLLQGAIFGNYGESAFSGCTFCKFRCNHALTFDALRERFSKETGVDLGLGSEGSLPFSKFPYKRFLKSANADIRKYFKNYFADVKGD